MLFAAPKLIDVYHAHSMSTLEQSANPTEVIRSFRWFRVSGFAIRDWGLGSNRCESGLLNHHVCLRRGAFRSKVDRFVLHTQEVHLRMRSQEVGNTTLCRMTGVTFLSQVHYKEI